MAARWTSLPSWRLVSAALLMTGVSASTCQTPADGYSKLPSIPHVYRSYLTIPATCIDCCYNWCNKKTGCQAFIYNHLGRTCQLIDYLGDLAQIASPPSPKETMYVKAGVTGPNHRCGHSGYLYHPTSHSCVYHNTTGGSFNQSSQACGNLRGRLFEVRSASAHQWLMQHIASLGGLPRAIYIGLHNYDGVWRWHSDQSPVSQFEYWTPLLLSNSGDCVIMRKVAPHHWRPYVCSPLLHSVCEILL